MPGYNCEKTVEGVFSRIPAGVMKQLHAIVVVNDGSKDATAKVLKTLAKKYAKIKILMHPVNKGYGAAQKTGFSEAVRMNADVAVLLHSDGQYPPEMLSDMITPMTTGRADVVLGSRIKGGQAIAGGMPRYKYFGNRALTILENLCYGMRVSEYHSGYMGYSKKALSEISFLKLSDTFHFDGEMLLMSGKRGLRIEEVPIVARYADEKSHLRPIKYGMDVLRIIMRNFMGKYDF
ncbi:hypothetical protein AUJ68_07290 [Candidatus Woesearchaeota archaeon CG1_02_57_44]|nr:MAG: hypothetical protein AUJ68_07290 [Candidatus Woesearchaeota archaeon CG1_02_57_44]